jgi:hypothetical protein
VEYVEPFRRRWSSHNVRLHGAGTKQFHHQVVGDPTLAYESLDVLGHGAQIKCSP